MVYYIYTITCAITSKVYVGCSKNPARRWIEHCSLAKEGLTNNHLHADIRAYGRKSFIMRILDSYLTKKQAKTAEACAIESLGTLHPDGYNLNSEQGAGKAHHKLTKQRISEHNLGQTSTPEQNKARSDALSGQPKSKEHADKISLALKGKAKSESTKQNMSIAAKNRASRARNEKGAFV